jgi:phosphatidylglycerophosphate synthase
MEAKPWDSRLARWMVRPLRDTRVSPNHVTTASLLVGLAGAALYAGGTPGAANAGAVLYCLSAFLDHADGELARLSGKTSDFGHVYDRLADLAVKISLFTGMGIGLRAGPLGSWAVLLGLVAGVSLVAIFLLRTELARLDGPAAFEQPAAAGFEIEDVLYAVAPITWVGWLQPFVVAAAVGAPLFALWTATRLRAARRTAAARR